MNKKWVVSRMWWGFIFTTDAVAILLFLTLWFRNSSVLYWLWDATYGVFEIAGFGAILGLCFDFAIKTLPKIKKHLVGTRAFHRLRNTGSLTKLIIPVKDYIEDNKHARI